MEVPTAKSLSEIYPEDAVESQTRRWNSLISKFREDYGKLPDFISRSPGRVNIIGEHIDYCLYEVLPMAITADVLLAVSVHPEESGPSTVRLVNVHPQKFESKNFEIPDTGDVHIDPSTLEWTNYFKSGLSGATELLRSKRKDFKQSVGMDIQADGTVPSGGGLSSSAAFVCASALAAMKANGVDKVDKKELVEVANYLRAGIQGSALYVSFVPQLSAENIAFPNMKSPLVFVIAQSFVAADKHVTAPVCYNLRVVEVTLAALVLAKILRVKSLPSDAGPLGVSLRGFHDAYFQEIEGIKNNHTVSKAEFQDQLQSLVGKVDQYLPQEEGYTRQQLSEILGMSVDEMEKKYMTKFPIRAERFKLRQRAMHVFSEAIRVLRFNELLHSDPPETDAENTEFLKACGSLMNETQESCRELFENSCPELDELCELARSAGSYGSRLTGAGWGGCSVHLVPENKVESVRQKWIERYYKQKFPDITEERLKEAIVVRQLLMAESKQHEAMNYRNQKSEENQKQAPFRLLDLPVELQLRIIDFAVRSDEPIEITGSDGDGSPGDKGKQGDDSVRLEAGPSNTPRCAGQLRSQPALTRTCRSIRVDALPLYYAGNRFRASYCSNLNSFDNQADCSVLAKWLSCIGERNQSFISELELFDRRSVEVATVEAEAGRDSLDLGDCCLRSALEQIEQPLSLACVQPGVYLASFPADDFSRGTGEGGHIQQTAWTESAIEAQTRKRAPDRRCEPVEIQGRGMA